MEGQGRPVQPYVGLLVSAALAIALFYSGVFAFLFAVPVQVTYLRRGRDAGYAATALTAGGVLLVHIAQIVRFGAADGRIVRVLLLDALMPIGLLAAVTLFNVVRGYPWWARLLAGTAVALLGAFPSLRLLAAVGGDDAGLSEQLTGMLTMLGVAEDPAFLIEAVRRIVFSTIGLGLMAAIAATWWLGRGIALRGTSGELSLRAARVDDRIVWFVITGLTGVVMEWLVEVPVAIGILGWNLALMGAFLFAIQGLGIIQHLLRRRFESERAERWVITVALAALFVPGINAVVTIGLPLFGMSELWIDYRRGRGHEGHIER